MELRFAIVRRSSSSSFTGRFPFAEKGTVEQSITVDNPQNKHRRRFDTEDYPIVTEDQMTVFRAEQLVFRYAGATEWYSFKRADLFFKVG